MGKPNGENARSYLAKTIPPLLFLTVGHIFGDNALWISEGVLRIFKRDAMLLQVFSILVLIPLKPVAHVFLTTSYSVKPRVRSPVGQFGTVPHDASPQYASYHLNHTCDTTESSSF